MAIETKRLRTGVDGGAYKYRPPPAPQWHGMKVGPPLCERKTREEVDYGAGGTR
jgi:hypothetical protein